jgi:C4-dicarboxylate-specific signal transduction histidine kinase
VLLNLMLNGADAMAHHPPGSRQLHIATTLAAGVVRLSVRDTGGDLPDNVEQLFEPFFTTKPHGLGMGLAICRTIVAAHRGQLRAAPHPAGGTVFEVEIPPCGAASA